MTEKETHVPVLLAECMEYLAPRPGGIYVDATLGGGGHSRAILSSISPGGTLIGIDRDPDAIANASRRLVSCEARVHLVRANYSELPEVLDALGIQKADGILCDLGLSSFQLEHSKRGFSFLRDEPLLMSMDGDSSGMTAEELVNAAPEEDLAFIFRELGEEPHARAVARAIVREREKGRISSSLALAGLIHRVKKPFSRGRERIHLATQCFQAIRMSVNDELGHLARLLSVFPGVLAPGGRMCVISFHSLEARMVKSRFRELAGECICPPDLPCSCGRVARGRIVTKKAVKPGAAEVSENPRSRSARLRVFESF